MKHFSLLFLILSAFGLAVSTNVCCPFPAYSFSAITNVTEENFKCSEPISFLCQFVTDDDSEPVTVGIAGNATSEEGNRPNMIKKGVTSVSASLVCDTSSNLWKVDKLSTKFANVGCIAKPYGGIWIIY